RLEHRASLGVLHHHAYGLSDSLRRMEAMGRGANLLERLHDHRRPLPGPAKGRGRAVLARAAAPLALRGVLGRRASHLSAYARGHAAPPIDDDPGLRGYGRFGPPGGPRPPVSVVVPFLGSAAEGEELARALEALERRPGDELIVVDNSPAPAFPGAAVRATAQRSSYFARNAGADRARGEWLLFLDADCRPRATLIDDYFAERIGERCGAVAGRVMAAPGQDALVARYARSRGHLSQAAHMRDDHLPYGITANLLVRRAAFDALGGFHEGLRSGGDADLSWRLQDEGWAIDYREPAAVWHLHRERVWPLVRQAARYSAAIAWMERHRPGSSARPRVARRLARAGAGAVAWLLLGRFERAAFKLLDGVVVVAEGAGYLFSNAAPQAADDARGGPAVIADAFPDAGRPARVPPGARLVEAARRPARLDRASASGLLVRYAEDDGIARRAGQTALLAALHPVRALGAWRSHHHHPGSGTGVDSKGTHRPRLAALAPAARRLAAAGPDWLAAAPGAERRARALARLTGTALAPEAPPLTASAGSGSSRSSRPASRSSPR
ncbi:MAG: hypothetical protein QOJ07_1416, partial [Thermoleophilaceae bacterium]|nr:hypothetical protein [Thermoleophilaceae bacterium]